MADTPEKPVMSKKIRAVFFVSLAMNLVVIGLVIGIIANGGPPRPPHKKSDPVMPYTRAFDEVQRDELRRSLRKHASGRVRGQQAELTQSYLQAVETLRRDPYEPAAFEAILDAQKKLADGRQRGGQQLLSEYIARMSPEERAAFADRLEDEVKHMSEKRRRWDDK